MADAISVYEVSPRDGLQNEKRIVPTADKDEWNADVPAGDAA